LDGTYKISVLGYPVIVIGTQNLEHHFRPIAIAFAKHEREKDYSFVLQSIKDALEKFYKYAWEVDLVMADASLAIFNATGSIFGNSYKHAMCSVHVFRNTEKKIISKVSRQHRKDLRNDLRFLEDLPDQSLFDIVIKLFEEKWKKKDTRIYRLLF